MIKTAIASCLVLAAASVGCASPSDSGGASASSDVTSAGTVSLAEARAEVAAARAKYEPSLEHVLLFDTSVAAPYAADLVPIFAHTAKTDKLTLAGDAFGYVSVDAQVDGILTGSLLDDAVAASYQDLWSFHFMFGDIASKPGFWAKDAALIGRSKPGPLADLQILELVTNATQTDIVTGLDALGWSKAAPVSPSVARGLVDPSQTYERLCAMLFGELAVVPSGTTHDIAADDTFGAQVFTRSFSELRLLSTNDDDGIVFVLGEHLSEAKQDTQHDATRGLALAKASLTAAELANLQRHL